MIVHFYDKFENFCTKRYAISGCLVVTQLRERNRDSCDHR